MPPWQTAEQEAPAAHLIMRAPTQLPPPHTAQVLRVPAHAAPGAGAAQPPHAPEHAPRAGAPPQPAGAVPPATGARGPEVTDLDLTLENDRLVATAANGSVCVWLVATGQLVRRDALACLRRVHAGHSWRGSSLDARGRACGGCRGRRRCLRRHLCCVLASRFAWLPRVAGRCRTAQASDSYLSDA